ncbi:MAG: glycosyltransferase family 2 protein [Cyanobacteria bacterium SIG30]|nr:glycosyltransferase family 2 protein [Cyanobacteria bacterium SIG30]
MTKISIIIPIFNAEKYLKECLDSIVGQSLKDIEIICIDDCSTDNSYTILQEYAQKDERIKILKQENNQGPGAARNRAIDVAKGKNIMFIDADDFFEQDALANAYNQISKNNDDMVYFDLQYYDETSKEVTRHNLTNIFRKYFNGQSFHLYDIPEPFVQAGYSVYKIYKTEFLKKNNIKFPDERFAEDSVFYIQCIANSDKVSVLDKSMYNYRKLNNSATTISATKNWMNICTIGEKNLNIMQNSKQAEKYLPKYLIYRINQLLYWYEYWSQIKDFDKKAYYQKMHKELKILDKKYSKIISANKKYIYDWANYKCFSKQEWNCYLVTKFAQKLFLVKKIDNCIKINILGIKIKCNKK